MKFSCIIPAYNEGPRIGKVLETILACDELDEVIVVNDGSSDDTWGVIDRFTHPKLQKISQKNVGKAKAIFAGIRIATGSHIVMIDSDLIGLNTKHIRALIAPARDGSADVTLSLRENSLGLYKFFGTDFVSGERVVPREIFSDEVYYTSGPGFGLEVKMNEKILAGKYRVENVVFRGVVSPRKSMKIGYLRGTLADWRMSRDILRIMPIWKLARQFWYFSRFSRR